MYTYVRIYLNRDNFVIASIDIQDSIRKGGLIKKCTVIKTTVFDDSKEEGEGIYVRNYVHLIMRIYIYVCIGFLNIYLFV
jgi:hypothetical protein